MKLNFTTNRFQDTAGVGEFQNSSLKISARQESKIGNNIKAMILAAGLGTRLKPFTDKHPKALAIINGKSLLQRNIEYLQQYNIYNVIVNTHHFAPQIEEAISFGNGWGSEVSISYEEQVLETGGGLKYVAPFFKDTVYFVLMNADVLTNMPLDKMIAEHVQQQALATLAISNRSSSRYLLFDENDHLCGWQNISTGEIKMARSAEHYNQHAFSGIHVISRRFLNCLNTFEGKFSIIDVYLQNAAHSVIHAFKHDGYLFADVGKPESITIAENLFK